MRRVIEVAVAATAVIWFVSVPPARADDVSACLEGVQRLYANQAEWRLVRAECDADEKRVRADTSLDEGAMDDALQNLACMSHARKVCETIDVTTALDACDRFVSASSGDQSQMSAVLDATAQIDNFVRSERVFCGSQ